MRSMAKSGFRIESITIEGFKAFTTSQTIDFLSKHAFLFGSNGRGKSSVIEAMVWCLFGTPEGEDVTAVTNKFYEPGECKVSLILRNEEGLWNYERRLPVGSNRARATISDPTGKERNQGEVFPNLSRLGHAPGAHIIVSQTESAHGRRTDISSIEHVLSSYLGLDPVPDLLKRLNDLLAEQMEVSKNLAEDISKVEDDLRERLAETDSHVEELLLNPPWSGGIPTRAETKQRIRYLAGTVASLTEKQLHEGSDSEMLQFCEQAMEQHSKSDTSQLQLIVRKHQEKLEQVAAIMEQASAIKEELSGLELSLGQIEEKLNEASGATSVTVLQAKLADMQSRLSTGEQKDVLIRSALSHLETTMSKECPLCGAPDEDDELKRRLELELNDIGDSTITFSTEVLNLRETIKTTTALQEQAEDITNTVQELKEQEQNESANLSTLLGLTDSSDELVMQNGLESVKKNLKSLEKDLEGKSAELTEIQGSISKHRNELRFQEYRSRQERLRQQLGDGLSPVRDELVEFEAFLTTT